MLSVLHHLRTLAHFAEPSPTALPTAPAEGSGRKTFSGRRTVPFGARLYVERLACAGTHEVSVRVLLNEAVLPLPWCGADAWGRCTMGRFVRGLGLGPGKGVGEDRKKDGETAIREAHVEAVERKSQLTAERGKGEIAKGPSWKERRQSTD